MPQTITGYVQGTSPLANFVQLAQTGNDTVVSVNADGTGSDFVAISTLRDITGLLLNDMHAQGNLLMA